MTQTPAEESETTGVVSRRGFLASAGVVSSYVAAGVAGFAGGALTVNAAQASTPERKLNYELGNKVPRSLSMGNIKPGL